MRYGSGLRCLLLMIVLGTGTRLACLFVATDNSADRKSLNIKHETSFVVFPADCNANFPMLFGGKVLAEMDRCAGVTTRRLLYASSVKDAVTVGIADMKFHRAGKVKDLLFVSSEVIKLGDKSITIRVQVHREDGKAARELLAEGIFTFVAYDTAAQKAVSHGLSLP